MKDFFRLVFADIKKFSVQKSLLFLEILFALIIAHICIGQIDNYIQLNKYYGHMKDMSIARVEESDTDIVAFCQQNGTELGPLDCFSVINSSDCEAYIYSEAMFDTTGLKDHMQYFSEDILNSESDVIAVVPFAMSNQYKVGSDYDITIRILDKRTDLSTLQQEPAVDLDLHLKVYAVLDSNYVFTPFAKFEKKPNAVILIDKNGYIEKNKITYGYYNNKVRDNYYLLNDTVTNEEVENIDVTIINDSIYSDIESLKKDVFKSLLITIIIFVLFVTGFLGQHLLNLDTLRINYAIYFFCGATRRKASALQFCSDMQQIAIPCLLSVVFMIYSELFHKFDMRWDYSILFCGIILFIFCSISILEIRSIHRLNPIEVIRKG